MTFLANKTFITFVVKFLCIFALCYFGTLAVIGASASPGFYSPFIAKYLDYVSGIKQLLIYGCGLLLKIFSIGTYTLPGFIIRIENGTGVMIAYDCVGYGVMSFWAAFVIASSGDIFKKIKWIIAGFLVLYIINVIRISLLLVAYNKNWGMPLGIDHHTWFNIVAYMAIFLMMYIFEKGFKRKETGARVSV